MEMVKLRTGYETMKPMVITTRIALEGLLEDGISGVTALYDAVMIARDPKYVEQVSDSNKEKLKSLALLDSGYKMHDEIRQCILALVEGDLMDMRLVNPYAPADEQPAATEEPTEPEEPGEEPEPEVHQRSACAVKIWPFEQVKTDFSEKALEEANGAIPSFMIEDLYDYIMKDERLHKPICEIISVSKVGTCLCSKSEILQNALNMYKDDHIIIASSGLTVEDCIENGMPFDDDIADHLAGMELLYFTNNFVDINHLVGYEDSVAYVYVGNESGQLLVKALRDSGICVKTLKQTLAVILMNLWLSKELKITETSNIMQDIIDQSGIDPELFKGYSDVKLEIRNHDGTLMIAAVIIDDTILRLANFNQETGEIGNITFTEGEYSLDALEDELKEHFSAIIRGEEGSDD